MIYYKETTDGDLCDKEEVGPASYQWMYGSYWLVVVKLVRSLMDPDECEQK